jgi:hypothetical protein
MADIERRSFERDVFGPAGWEQGFDLSSAPNLRRDAGMAGFVKRDPVSRGLTISLDGPR